jgi:hypothetical protein
VTPSRVTLARVTLARVTLSGKTVFAAPVARRGQVSRPAQLSDTARFDVRPQPLVDVAPFRPVRAGRGTGRPRGEAAEKKGGERKTRGKQAAVCAGQSGIRDRASDHGRREGPPKRSGPSRGRQCGRTDPRRPRTYSPARFSLLAERHGSRAAAPAAGRRGPASRATRPPELPRPPRLPGLRGYLCVPGSLTRESLGGGVQGERSRGECPRRKPPPTA